MMAESLRGQFLISGPRLRDPNFFKSVVLMVEHGPDGSMGLVVNHPSSDTVSHVLREHFDLPETEELVFVGGPVEPKALFVVHNSPTLDPTEMPVIPGVYMGSSADVFQEILEATTSDQEPGLKFRVFGGYTGWGPGQLEGELDRGDWLTTEADQDHVYTANPYRVWDQVIQKSYAERRLLPKYCEHPEWN